MNITTGRIDHAHGGHSYVLDNQYLMSVSGILRGGVPKDLTKWAAEATSAFAVDHLGLLRTLERDEAYDLCVGAMRRDRDRAANRGTEVHCLAEQIAAGGQPEIPLELRGHVAAYEQFRSDWEPREEIVEQVVLSRRWRYGGTFDLWAKLPTLGPSLIDIKTNRSGPFAEVALQLAGYAHADFMWADGEERPMPEIRSFAVLWLRADGYDLFPYEITEREWHAFLNAREMALWTRGRVGQVKGFPMHRVASTEAAGREREAAR